MKVIKNPHEKRKLSKIFDNFLNKENDKYLK